MCGPSRDDAWTIPPRLWLPIAAAIAAYVAVTVSVIYG